MPAPQHHLPSTEASGMPFAFLIFGFLVSGMGVQTQLLRVTFLMKGLFSG